MLVVRDLATLDWPTLAKRAGLTTIATHIFPHEVLEFLRTDDGRSFLDQCHRLGIEVEHELHAMSDLLPRELFAKDPSMFRMDEAGERVRDHNLCVSSEAALEVVCEYAVRYTEMLPSTTGRYFYWIDDGQPMCRCPKCRELSDSDQALLLENRAIGALRGRTPDATLAHLVYSTTLAPPTQVKPAEGLFMEFAPISRQYDIPFRERSGGKPGYPSHGELLDSLDANLEVFGAEDAQVLEYWLDCSLFSDWKRGNLTRIPWYHDVFLDDLDTYAQRGITQVTTFGAWIDSTYVARFGEPPLGEYGAALLGR